MRAQNEQNVEFRASAPIHRNSEPFHATLDWNVTNRSTIDSQKMLRTEAPDVCYDLGHQNPM